MATLKDLKEKRAKILNDQREMLDRCEKENRGFNTEEDHKYRSMDVEFETITDQIEELRTHAQKINDARESARYDNRQTNTFLNSTFEDTPELRALGAYFKGSNPDEYRDLQKDEDGKGGYLVTPAVIADTIFKDVDNITFIRNLATIFRTGKANSVAVPYMNNDVSDVSWTGEITEADLDTSLDFSAGQFTPNRLVKGIKVSEDLLNLSTPNVGGFVVQRLEYKIQTAMENGYLTGNGAGIAPLGVFTPSDAGIPADRDILTGSPTGIVADALINAKFNLKAQYLQSPNCRWGFHRDGVKMIRKLKDGEGQYLWAQGFGQEADTILSIPYVMSEFINNTFTQDNYFGILGDWKMYGISEYDMVSVKTLTELYALTGQVAFLIKMHSTGAPMIPQAFTRLKCSA